MSSRFCSLTTAAILFLGVAGFVSTTARGDEPAGGANAASGVNGAAANGTAKPQEMVVDPQSEPAMPLRYRLTPSPREMRPGNAAPIYLRLVHEQNDDWKKRINEEASRIMELPLSEVRPEEVAKFVSGFSNALEQLHHAALREQCSWEYTFETKNASFTLLLSDAQFMRAYARLLAAKARGEIANHRYDAAIETLSDGFALARNVSTTPLVVCRLIGTAIGGVMLQQLETLISQPDAPNLYWADVLLPQPLISMREASQFEGEMLLNEIPDLSRLAAHTSAAEWSRMAKDLKTLARQMVEADPDAKKQTWLRQMNEGKIDPARWQTARQGLIELGRHTPEAVKAMSDDEVLVRYSVLAYEQIFEQYFKWTMLPYWQGAAGWQQMEDQEEHARRIELIPLASTYLTIMRLTSTATARLQRRVAALATIEGLRDFAATHERKLPASLAELRLPAPIDPITGKTLGYAVEDDSALLTSPAPFGYEQAEDARLNLRVKIRPAK